MTSLDAAHLRIARPTNEPLDPELLARIEAAGGVRTPSRNDWWDQGGVTFADPDGYLLVLTSRSWTGTP